MRSPGLHAHVGLVREVAAALRRDEGNRALDLLRRIAPAFGLRAETLVMRALALGLVGDLDHALPTLRQALTIDPRSLDDPQWGTRAALLSAKAGDFSLAADILTRVIGNLSALPLRGELFALLGDVRLAQGPSQLDAAVVAYREALRGLVSAEARSLLGLALALRRQQERAASAEVASRITAGARVEVVVGTLPVPATEKAARLAIASEARGNVEEALAHWTEASAEGPWKDHAAAEAAATPKLKDARKRAPKP